MHKKQQDQSQIKWVSDFIWNIADDRLRDVYVRGKYRDVILPFTVLRRLDAVLESTKEAVLERKKFLDAHKVVEQDGALRMAAGQAFYNVSDFTLTKLKASAAGQRLRDDFIAYLDGFSPNVQEILSKFNFRNQIQKLVDSQVLGYLIDDFLDPKINLSPLPVKDADGRIRLPALDNHGMGTVFEELIRRFNEENNDQAGEHFTPRDVVQLMAKLLFLPVADRIESSTYSLYDGSCGTGGMLTVAEDALLELAEEYGKDVSIHLFGQEISDETYAICKADLLLKGEGEEAENIVGGADKSTLSADQFSSREFDFMISNPPYGKSWKTDLERMGGKKEFSDPRFIVNHGGDAEFKLITRSSDGQLMFLVNKLQKMKHNTPLGSRIALVHNGSALFTGDAGQGESNIRRWVLENDWLEAIIALPLNIFYNTGIATYIWVLANKKAEYRKGRVQLIDASKWFQPLRRNLGRKNCELSEADIKNILDLYLGEPQENENCKWFDIADFGYRKITVERPLRLKSQLKSESIESLRFASGDEALRAEIYKEYGEKLYTEFAKVKPLIDAWLKGEDENNDDDSDEEGEENKSARQIVPAKRRKKLLDGTTWGRDKGLVELALLAQKEIGQTVFDDHNEFRTRFDAVLKANGKKLGAAEKKMIYRAVSWRDETAPPVIAKRNKLKESDFFEQGYDGVYLEVVGKDRFIVEYEADSDLRDTEQVPLKEQGGIDAFFEREVLPFAQDSWIAMDKTQIGYEISFARYFYKPAKLRTLQEIRTDILELEQQSEGLLHKIVGAQ
ncbi:MULTISPECIES: class I SAM-dependent DNA methyltransferase [Enterobacteriaceae]|jgi:type I restriction enzyme M protein|uniref:site-specific DNA-methyltransferase (adenine-specific) n=11 Tax=Klebsiella pneumoniae TaxID=573 RepID=A0A2X3E6Y6_KLEPN|nr:MULTISPECIES: class I SAM-dependent DNA methyltransferase [Enterobacteriaceae]EAB8046201.1 SAM-dependent DNA methyltransferase [Salmonella enterica subsp. enterica serovar Tees]EDV2954377.1 SAM-dependent DNA methyltransferase [Salmonella enterica subsp. enterica]EKE2795745.1 SAM-dependent DNA methyltransferase [Salmonella enterica]EKX4007417.1 SAM-dependent DNA methyltransferase [Enterobacter cloacae]AGX41061.1 N-6 DNA methylase [Klebsiella pneumoniae CG43]